ncbi:hypothetical protein GCM10020255_001630 [Rhodococcus baikonurensis]
MQVRAFYLDLAHWAVEDPARWAQWVAPCPISDAEVKRGKELKHRKARMDQRTRERLPVLSQLVRSAADRRAAAAALLVAAQNTEPGEVIAGTEGELRRSLILREPAASYGPTILSAVFVAISPTRTRKHSGHSPPSKCCGSAVSVMKSSSS